jgi:hypothetical protein
MSAYDGDVLAREELEQQQEAITTPEPPAAEVAPPVSTPAEQVASSVGNHAFGQMIGRSQGDGIMPGGTVHPDIEQTIASSRGSGHGLDGGVTDKLSPSLGDLSDVTVHTDTTADSLARSVSARAFATGSDVYFAQGEYQPGTKGGDSLIAHELTHVVQQRGAPASGPLTVSEPGDSLEREADAVAGELAG